MFPSTFNSPPSFFSHEIGDILLHHQQDLMADLLYPPNAASVVNEGIPISNPAAVSKRAKRDRRSKIATAQGPRDRRVRLSIEIARKFFDLQEMLGFDKASKTLGWLFTNSKTAIEELIEMKLNYNDTLAESLSSASECEVLSESNGDRPLLTSLGKDKIEDGVPQRKSPFHLRSKEWRDKARARATERTREKIIITNLRDSNKLPIITNQSLLWGENEFSEKLGFISRTILPSIMMKGNLKPTLDHERNLINITKHLSSTCNNLCPDISENWDYGITTTRPNPPTEPQNCGKPWGGLQQPVHYN